MDQVYNIYKIENSIEKSHFQVIAKQKIVRKSCNN